MGCRITESNSQLKLAWERGALLLTCAIVIVLAIGAAGLLKANFPQIESDREITILFYACIAIAMVAGFLLVTGTRLNQCVLVDSDGIEIRRYNGERAERVFAHGLQWFRLSRIYYFAGEKIFAFVEHDGPAVWYLKIEEVQWVVYDGWEAIARSIERHAEGIFEAVTPPEWKQFEWTLRPPPGHILRPFHDPANAVDNQVTVNSVAKQNGR